MDLDALLTTTQAAQLAGVTKQLLYRWRQLGHLTPADTYPQGPLFRAADVLAAERDTRRSPLSHRKPAA